MSKAFRATQASVTGGPTASVVLRDGAAEVVETVRACSVNSGPDPPEDWWPTPFASDPRNQKRRGRLPGPNPSMKIVGSLAFTHASTVSVPSMDVGWL